MLKWKLDERRLGKVIGGFDCGEFNEVVIRREAKGRNRAVPINLITRIFDREEVKR